MIDSIKERGKMGSFRPRTQGKFLFAGEEKLYLRVAEAPLSADLPWPRISVIVCSHNGERTLPHCLEGLLDLEYPDFEVIAVDDGSTDSTAAIAREYSARLITTENRGLSNARNVGMKAATGEIVAYLDDDARPYPHWLTYLAATFLSTEYAGVGGPNITHPSDGPIAECVGNSPGNLTHVLLSDREAEHNPGCNMAFRTARLEEIGGSMGSAGSSLVVCAILSGVAILLVLRTLQECAVATAATLSTLRKLDEVERDALR